jgi:hypothetical protein
MMHGQQNVKFLIILFHIIPVYLCGWVSNFIKMSLSILGNSKSVIRKVY